MSSKLDLAALPDSTSTTVTSKNNHINGLKPMHFFTEDIVERTDGSGIGVVARSWQEQPEYDTSVAIPDDPLQRPLAKGEVGVQSYPSGTREISSESDFRLIDRSFVRGDFCKREQDDVQSGVILNVKVDVKVQHAITMQAIDKWFDKEEFCSTQPLSIGDIVLYDDWVGQVEEVFNEALIASPTSKMQPVYELGGRFAVGEKCYGYAMTGNSAVPPSTPEPPTDVIVKVTPIVAAISWSAINQSLDPSAAQGRKRPPQFWAIDELHKLVAMRSRGSVAGCLGERVIFAEPQRATQLGVQPKFYKDDDFRMEFAVEVMVVSATRTMVEVLWQDGTREWVPARSVTPHMNLDEYECWPGDCVLWKGEEEKRVAVVQSVRAKDRVARVRWYGTDILEDVSVLELDPHGMSYENITGGPDSFGVRRGEIVLIHGEDTSNGLKEPLVPRIGELEPWVQEAPSRNADGNVEDWRRHLTNNAMKVLGFDWSRREDGTQQSLPNNSSWVGQVVDVMSGSAGLPGRFEAPSLSTSDEIDWFGQVVDLTLDGSVVVSLPSLRRITVPIRRISVYRDVEDYPWDGDAPGDDIMDDIGDPGEELSEEILEAIGNERDDWSHMDTDDTGNFSPSEDIQSSPILGNPHTPVFTHHRVMPGSFEASPPPSDDSYTPSSGPDIPSSVSAPLGSTLPRSSTSAEDVQKLLEDQPIQDDEHMSEGSETGWNRFEILAEAPADHAFYSTEPAQPTKSFLSRLAKEYRVLESSLPDSILVRGYEDRADLLRCLIIGPENTPYEDAPFVIDWRLEGSFPHTPPIAHFFSWTNGNGRVNPNLYEEGKVCLSILGTWAGERSESWNASRSSLLQAFVSIQGLVLVKEPYFCEPAFEKMRGTEEGAVNRIIKLMHNFHFSRLYSEKAYVLSRGFVRRALDMPLSGLEEEMSWLYYKKGRLSKLILDADNLIKRSGSEEDTEITNADLAIPKLSMGGVIALNRTLTKLRTLLETRKEQ